MVRDDLGVGTLTHMVNSRPWRESVNERIPDTDKDIDM